MHFFSQNCDNLHSSNSLHQLSATELNIETLRSSEIHLTYKTNNQHNSHHAATVAMFYFIKKSFHLNFRIDCNLTFMWDWTVFFFRMICNKCLIILNELSIISVP